MSAVADTTPIDATGGGRLVGGSSPPSASADLASSPSLWPAPAAACSRPAAIPAPLTFTAPLAARVWHVDFDVGAYRPSQLLELSRAIFQHAECLTSEDDTPDEDQRYRVDPESLGQFLQQVQRHHHPENTYHGWTHGVHVQFNTLRLLLPVLERFTRIERFTLLLSAVCHDMQHCGQSNGWCIESEYWCNEDHAAKKWTRNLLERNSVERTIELLTGRAVSVPFGSVSAVAAAASSSSSCNHTDGPPSIDVSSPSSTTSSTGASASASASTPAADSRHFLREWGFSPALQATFLANLTEYILNTDIADKERHRRVTDELTQLVARKPTTTTTATANGTADSTPSAATATSPSDDHAFAFTFSSPSHRLALSRVTLLCADIGCVSELFPNVISWADRLYEESMLGQSFVAVQAPSNDLPSPLARKAAMELRQEHVQSRYRFESEEPCAVTAANTIASPPSQSAPSCSSSFSPSSSSFFPSSCVGSSLLVDECPTIHGPLIPCVELAAYYANQHHFFSKYAIPLYTPVHASGLLPTVSERFYPQLLRNLRYIEVTEAVKPQNGKLQIHARVDAPGGNDTERVMEQLQEEFEAIAAFHESLNQQQLLQQPPADADTPTCARIRSLAFSRTPAQGEEDAREPMQPHADHAHWEGVRCVSHT